MTKNNKFNIFIAAMVVVLMIATPFVVLFGNIRLDLVFSALLILCDVAFILAVFLCIYIVITMLKEAIEDKDNKTFFGAILLSLIVSLLIGLLIILIMSTPSAITNIIATF